MCNTRDFHFIIFLFNHFTGVFGIPQKIVAKAAYEALNTYDNQSGPKTLKEVRFVNLDVEVKQVFVSVFMSDNNASAFPSAAKPSLESALDSTDHLIFTSDCGITIEAYCGNLLDGSTEAVVCSVNGNLNLGGGAARAVARKAGQRELEEECRRLIAEHGGQEFVVGETMHVGSHELTNQGLIRFVVLVVGPTNSEDRDLLHTELIESFYNCIKYANNTLKVSSLAIPAISSGMVHWINAYLLSLVDLFAFVEYFDYFRNHIVRCAFIDMNFS